MIEGICYLMMIDRKVSRQEVVVIQEEHEEAKIIDIMEALKARKSSRASGK
jgi:non-homologous end joining protein Ku